MRVLWVFVLALLVSACAIGNTYDYSKAKVDVAANTDRVVAIGVRDRRPYILDEDKSADFIGLQRAGFGNPYSVYTTTGNAMATDFTTAISRAFSQKGINAKPVAVTDLVGSSEFNGAQVSRLARKYGAEKVLIFRVTEWKTDRYARTTFDYDVRATVFDKGGELLATALEEGRKVEVVTGLSASVEAFSNDQFQKIMSSLVNDEDIRQALAS